MKVSEKEKFGVLRVKNLGAAGSATRVLTVHRASERRGRRRLSRFYPLSGYHARHAAKKKKKKEKVNYK